MRIGIFCPYNYFLPGGVQEHVRAQAEELKRRGHFVRVLTPRPYRSTHEAEDGIVFIGTSRRVKAPHGTSGDISANIDTETLKIIEDLKLDVLHVHEPLVPFMARQLLSSVDVASVGTFHAALPGNVLGKSFTGSYKAYARSVLPHIDAVTAVSPAAIGYIESEEELNVTFIPNGIDFDEYKPTKKVARSGNIILFIGRLEKRKGVRQLLEAFEIVQQKRSDAILMIAGDGPLRKSLESYANNHELQNVDFLGYITTEEKKALLQKAAVFTTPALYGESFGIVLAEAMALGAPIVAHANPGYEWVLKSTGQLSLTDAEEPETYARTLLMMMENSDIREIWQKWAAEYVKQFSYKNIVDAYEKVYKDLLKK